LLLLLVLLPLADLAGAEDRAGGMNVELPFNKVLFIEFFSVRSEFTLDLSAELIEPSSVFN